MTEALGSDDLHLRMRMDVIREVISYDPETGIATQRIEPDPRRYAWQERKGQRLLWDRFDQVLISHAVVMDMLKQAVQMPMPAPLPILGDLARWLRERRSVIGRVLDGEAYEGEAGDRSEALLESLPERGEAFVILSMDLAGSSAWSAVAPAEMHDRLLEVLAYEGAQLVVLFYGEILRYEGDGLVAYFPQLNFITKNDLALDCALCLNRLIEDAINPELAARGLAPVHARIGVEAGQAAVILLGAAATKRHRDLVGEVLAVAANARKQAEPGQVILGEICERNTHVMWRAQTTSVEPSDGWPYRIGDLAYKLYGLAADAKRPVEQPPLSRGALREQAGEGGDS